MTYFAALLFALARTSVASDLFAANGGEVDLFSNGLATASWAMPVRVKRCPIHAPMVVTSAANGGFWLDPAGGGKFSVIEAKLPTNGLFGIMSTGLRFTYSANACESTDHGNDHNHADHAEHGCPAGETGHSLWRIRVSSESTPNVRWTHLFSVPSGGVTSEVRHMPWKDFTGQKLMRRSIVDCSSLTAAADIAECTLDPSKLTHISFLESEDTISHPIHVEKLIITSNVITEKNADQHHSEEAEALIWEREHHMVYNSDMLDTNHHKSTTVAIAAQGVVSADAHRMIQPRLWTLLVAIAGATWCFASRT